MSSSTFTAVWRKSILPRMCMWKAKLLWAKEKINRNHEEYTFRRDANKPSYSVALWTHQRLSAYLAIKIGSQKKFDSRQNMSRGAQSVKTSWGETFDRFLYHNPKIKVELISPTLHFSNLSITRTKRVSLPLVKHCNFTPDFSSNPIF